MLPYCHTAILRTVPITLPTNIAIPFLRPTETSYHLQLLRAHCRHFERDSRPIRLPHLPGSRAAVRPLAAPSSAASMLPGPPTCAASLAQEKSDHDHPSLRTHVRCVDEASFMPKLLRHALKKMQLSNSGMYVALYLQNVARQCLE